MRLGAAVHSSSPAAAEIPQWLYIGSRETSVCRLQRVSSFVGRGANQLCGMISVVGDGSASSEVGESDLRLGIGYRLYRLNRYDIYIALIDIIDFRF